MLKNSKGCVRAPVDFDVFYGVERIVLKDVVFNLWDGILFNRAECKLWRRTTLKVVQNRHDTQVKMTF